MFEVVGDCIFFVLLYGMGVTCQGIKSVQIWRCSYAFVSCFMRVWAGVLESIHSWSGSFWFEWRIGMPSVHVIVTITFFCFNRCFVTIFVFFFKYLFRICNFLTGYQVHFAVPWNIPRFRTHRLLFRESISVNYLAVDFRLGIAANRRHIEKCNIT